MLICNQQIIGSIPIAGSVEYQRPLKEFARDGRQRAITELRSLARSRHFYLRGLRKANRGGEVICLGCRYSSYQLPTICLREPNTIRGYVIGKEYQSSSKRGWGESLSAATSI